MTGAERERNARNAAGVRTAGGATSNARRVDSSGGNATVYAPPQTGALILDSLSQTLGSNVTLPSGTATDVFSFNLSCPTDGSLAVWYLNATINFSAASAVEVTAYIAGVGSLAGGYAAIVPVVVAGGSTAYGQVAFAAEIDIFDPSGSVAVTIKASPSGAATALSSQSGFTAFRTQ